MGSSKRDLKKFPRPVQRVCGFALRHAQKRGKHPDAKPLKGFGGAGVLEIAEDFEGNSYRAVYTVSFSRAVYVLHAFQKKSNRGIKIPNQEIELIEKRLKMAEEHYEEWSRAKESEGKKTHSQS
jgi:phage-related protein